jgi:WD40 repeat protein
MTMPDPALARPGSRVLLVGTGRPPDGSPLPAVPQVGASLADLAAALCEQAGVPAGNLRVLTDPPSPLEFGRAVAQAAAAATDALLIYYAGHGLVGRDDSLYLATAATHDLIDDLPYSALPYAALRQATAACRARTIAVMLDCCFSGRADPPGARPASGAVFEQTPVRGGFLLAATAREELGLARPGAAHTAFAGALIGLLRDGDATAPEYLTLDDVYRYLSRVLPEDGAPRPRRQSSDHAGDMIVARNRAYLSTRAGLAAAPATGAAPGTTGAAPGTAGPPAPCPYRGLAAYGPQDARYFFGRAAIVGELTRRVTADGGMIAVVGPSGCGKTSLLRAGLVPALEATPPGWTVARMTPGPDPAATLCESLAALAAHRPAALLVDQFEELFTAGAPDAGQERFASELAAAAAGAVTVVIAIRADFYQACTRFPALVRALESHQVVVGPMTPGELRTVIEAPARAAGADLEEGLADTLLRDARTYHRGVPGAVLPLLSHALLETWHRSPGQLTLAGYQATGGVDGAVARTAEDAYASVDPADQPALRALLLRLVSLGDGTEDTRRRLPLADLTDPGSRRVLAVLVTARLVTTDTDGAEIAHEAVLHAWPRLRAWLEEDRAALLARQHLEDAARAWEQAGRQDADLYRGTRLEAADQAAREQSRVAGTLTAVAQAFLDASLRRRDADRREARRRTVRLRAAVSAIAALILVAAIAGGYSASQHQQAIQNAAVVHSTDLAAVAAGVDAIDPGLAAQFAVAAYRSAPTAQATAELYSVTDTPVDRVIDNMDSPVARVAAQPGGPLAAAVDAAGLLRIWDLADPASPALETTIHAGTTGLAFAPRSSLLAGPCPAPAKVLCLWNVGDPRRPAVTAPLPVPASARRAKGGVSGLAFSPDGTLLAAAGTNGVTLVWSVAQPARPRLLAILPNPASGVLPQPAAVAFAPRGHLLAETIDSGQTRLWRFPGEARPVLVATIRSGYASVAFSPTGSLLAAAGDGNLGLWRVGDPSRPVPVNVQFADLILADLMSVAISPGGTELTYAAIDTADANGQLCVVDLSAPGQGGGIASPDCTTTGFGTNSVAYTASGGLLSGGQDGRVRLWRGVLPRADGAEALAASSPAWDVSPDGRTMAAPVANPSGLPAAVGIWELAAPGGPRRAATLPVAPKQIEYVSATALLTVAADGAVRLWDLADPGHPAEGVALGSAAMPADATGEVASAAGLVEVQGGDSLQLWRVTGARDATRAGSVPAPGVAPDNAGLTRDGRAAVAFTAAGIDWWDISDPARPVHRGFSPFPGMNLGIGVGTDRVFVAAPSEQPDTIGSPLELFDPARGRFLAPVTARAGAWLDISRDGRLLAATGAGNNTVSLWDISDPAGPKRLSTFLTVPGVSGISFDPAGGQLAVWNGGTVQLWNIILPDNPALLGAVTIGTPVGGSVTPQVVSDVAYDPAGGGRTLLVSAGDSVYVVDADPAALASRLCQDAAGSLTHAQWSQYAANIPYRNPCP